MRHKLTDQEKQFIENNYQKLTLVQMANVLGLPSPFKVQGYCAEHGLSKGKKGLTDEQKQYVRDNYLHMMENDMVKELGVTKSHIQQFKRSEGLARMAYNREKKSGNKVVKNEKDETFFNVDSRCDWVA